ncbi:MAG: ParB/RepB/Spo0J family partition protein [Acidobacteriaceae bacterium]|nr:ParB/RepB/Spo0J family partition protein [Acidobacteriaceae bacterium]
MSKEVNQSQRKALGKGLSALLPSRTAGHGTDTGPHAKSTAATPARSALPEAFESFESIPLGHIVPSEHQPRTSWDAERLDELAQSIRAHGVIQPITVCKVAADRFTIIAGERRWRAAGLAGLKDIPALVRTVEQNRLLELALIENIQREDLNPIETALAFCRLIEQHKLTHDQVAERTGKDRSTITNFLRLLKLAPEVQNDLIRGDISSGHARALLALPTAKLQATICQKILDEGLSVRATEKLVKQTLGDAAPVNGHGKQKSAPAGEPDANVRAAIRELEAALGTRVRLLAKGNGSGRIEIEYYSQDDLDRIYSVIVRS